MTKFRAWDKDEKNMHYFTMKEIQKNLGFEYGIPNNLKPAYDDDNFNSDEFMQYIGLNDTKRTEEYPEGQEIYAGDIAKSVYSNGALDQIAEVVCKSPCEWYWGKYGTLYQALTYNKDTEVIGNIYENSELLEENK